jgi:phi13 family phage major tail protein
MKIEYGLKNVYVAKRTVTEGVVSYDTPVAIPYARSTDLAPTGETTPVYADNIEIETLNSNQGYSGTVNFTAIPDSFLETFLGFEKDENGVLVEDAEAQPVAFALMFQFENDVKAKRHVFYNCVATRPNVASNTKEASISVNDKTLNVTARADSEVVAGRTVVKGSTTADTNSTAYNAWFTAVQVPEFAETSV